MYRKDYSIYGVWNYLRFQGSSGVLEHIPVGSGDDSRDVDEEAASDRRT